MKMYHPTLPAIRDVPEGDVEKWAEAGWRKSEPKKSTPAPSQKSEPKKSEPKGDD